MSLFDHSQMNDHIDFSGSVLYRLRRFKAFGSTGRITVWKTDNRADGQPARKVIGRRTHIAGGNANRRYTGLNPFVAQMNYLLPSGSRGQQGMVYRT